MKNNEQVVERHVTLYHRTDPGAAGRILAEGRFVSICQDAHHAFFSNRRNGAHGNQYGRAVVEVSVRACDAIADETYRDGEVFYRVPLDAIGSDDIISAGA